MALIKCPDCGKAISDIAPACPGCGRPNAKAGDVAVYTATSRDAQHAPGEASIGKMKVLLVLVAILMLIVIATKFTTGGAGQTAQAPPSDSAGALRDGTSDPADFDKLQFKSEAMSDDLDQNGRQQFLFIFTNTSHKNFVGTIAIRALDAAGGQVDSDIFGPATVPADGGSARATGWFEKPFAIRKFTMQPSGSFHALARVMGTVPFEELSIDGGHNVFIYTKARDSVSIWHIAQAYKTKYAAENQMAIEFFHDKKKAARHFPMNDAALSVQTAAYELNRTSGFEQLHMLP